MKFDKCKLKEIFTSVSVGTLTAGITGGIVAFAGAPWPIIMGSATAAFVTTYLSASGREEIADNSPSPSGTPSGHKLR